MTTMMIDQWVAVCAVGDLVPERGVAALVAGEQVAVFAVDGSVHAVSNRDPFSDTNVISRGLVGTSGDVLKVTSPMYKQSFDLRTGQCLDDPSRCLSVYPARVT